MTFRPMVFGLWFCMVLWFMVLLQMGEIAATSRPNDRNHPPLPITAACTGWFDYEQGFRPPSITTTPTPSPRRLVPSGEGGRARGRPEDWTAK
jgi:hypothetical protein